MPARNRSGPPPNPLSTRSESRGLSWRVLDPHGYQGERPDFPLPDPTLRELEVWDEVWTAPQAEVWSEMPYRWRQIGLWCRFSVRTEDRRCSASILGEVHRYADQIGLTPAGMKENGWIIGSTMPEKKPEISSGSDMLNRFQGAGNAA